MPDGRYLTTEEWKAWAGDEVTADLGDVGAAILAAQQYIDNACSRRFAVAGAASARTYAPGGDHLLFIDDCTTITSIVENAVTLTTGDDYQAEPLNNLSFGGETVPFDRVRRLDGHWYRDGDKATVTVTAAWGWAAVPFEVVEACKMMTKMLLESRKTRFGLVDTVDGAMSQRFETLVRPIVAQYRGPRSWGIA